MVYAVFSDLHGNILALNAFLQDTKGKADGYIFLGDICGYFYHQKECIEQLRQVSNMICVQGNHDAYYLESRNNAERKEKLIKKYGCSYNETLSASDCSFLRKMPAFYETEIDQCRIFCVHGGLKDYLEERIYPNKISDYIRNMTPKYDVYLTGHTHYSLNYLLPNGGIWINPGSLGQPRDGRGFRYCLIDFKNRTYEFKHVWVEKEQLMREIDNYETDISVSSYLKESMYRGNDNGNQFADVSGGW